MSSADTKKAWRARVRGTVPPDHGRQGYVDYGCRCEVCTAGNTTSQAEHRARRRGNG